MPPHKPGAVIGEFRHKKEMAMEQEATIRLGFFFGILAIVALGELFSPRRVLTTPRPVRWFSNLGVVAVDTLAVRLLFPIIGVQVAMAARENGWGLLNILDLPAWLSVLMGILILDLVIYLQHIMFHTVPLLWRLHMMHHADLDIDVTTGLRFHPIEILISMVIKMTVIAALGPTVLTVIIFEIILNGTAMFNHGNLKLPIKLDRYLRLLVVTPDMHRVHHSVTIRETNSNFGFNFPWWDRIFGTYRAQPVLGHEKMTIGLAQFRDPGKNNLFHMLQMPFTEKAGSYAIDGHGADPERLIR
ncbi:MAG: sterol desaturase family protein [Desulfobulbaceae bacterium]|nr:sterol desaturase family protein [Desulfobulbaceae bacterium]